MRWRSQHGEESSHQPAMTWKYFVFTSLAREAMKFSCFLTLAMTWKYFVFTSPSLIQVNLDFWRALSAPSLQDQVYDVSEASSNYSPLH
jgi:hypothetical protein